MTVDALETQKFGEIVLGAFEIHGGHQQNLATFLRADDRFAGHVALVLLAHHGLHTDHHFVLGHVGQCVE